MCFSIIIPVFNSNRRLEECIESILSQTYQDWELILVNDGSTDGSGEICDRYAVSDSRIRVFHKQNEGVSKARNLGLRVSTGDWVTFCDSDDELFPAALDAYLSAINDSIDLIRSGFVRIKDGSVETISISKIVETEKEKIIKTCSSSRYEAYIWNSCFRKDILANVFFDECITWCEDHLFTFTAISKSRVVAFIPNTVYKYNAPSKVNVSCIDNLSNRYLEPKLIIREAIDERQIKIGMCGNISNDCLKLINDEFNYKIKLALKYSVLGNKYLEGINICRNYVSATYSQYVSLILHLKIFPTIWKFIRIIGNRKSNGIF